MKGLWIVVLVCAGISAFSQGYDTIPNVPDHYVKRLAAFRAEATTKGKILFLGNSITEAGKWRKLLKDSSVINRGISGDNTFGVLNRLDEVIRFQPSKLFLLIGVNDLSKSIPNSRIIENIFTIVNRIRSASPKTKIYVQSILPVNPGVKTFMTRFGKQDDILEINKQLVKYHEALQYTYIDLHSQFLNDKMLLNEQFTYDGLHLNAAGYAHWISILKKSKYL